MVVDEVVTGLGAGAVVVVGGVVTGRGPRDAVVVVGEVATGGDSPPGAVVVLEAVPTGAGVGAG